MLSEFIDRNKIPYFICIGTMKSVIDSVAPRIGTILKSEGFNVIGTEDEQLHARNLKEIYNEVISKIDTNVYEIIAIDVVACCKYDNDNVPVYFVKEGSLRPGAAVSKSLPNIGDISIKCPIRYSLKDDSFFDDEISYMFAIAQCVTDEGNNKYLDKVIEQAKITAEMIIQTYRDSPQKGGDDNSPLYNELKTNECIGGVMNV